jgi:methionyl-tRNA formyltransferase
MKKNVQHQFVVIGGTHRAVLTLRKILKDKIGKIEFAVFMEDYFWDKQWLPELEKIAQKERIPYHTYRSGEKIRLETIKKINEIKPLAIIGIGTWRTILNPTFWKNSKFGYIGLHGSMLPEYRGFAGLNWYVINGEKEYGMQMIQLNAGIDSGNLVTKKNGTLLNITIPLPKIKTMKSIVKDVEKVHVKMITELMRLIKKNDLNFIKQNEKLATWTCHRGPDNGEIDWNQNTVTIHDFIRGQSDPYPGAYSFYENKKISILKTTIPKTSKKYVGRICGKIVERHSNGDVVVLTQDGTIIINEIRVDGKYLEPGKFLKSVRQTLGYQPRKEIDKLKDEISELKSIINKIIQN